MARRQARIKNYFAENRLFMVRGIVASVLAFVLLCCVAGRLFYLQVIKYNTIPPLPGQSHPHRAHSAQPRADPRP